MDNVPTFAMLQKRAKVQKNGALEKDTNTPDPLPAPKQSHNSLDSIIDSLEMESEDKEIVDEPPNKEIVAEPPRYFWFS